MATKKKKKENKKKNSRPNYGDRNGKLYVPDDMARIMNTVYLPQSTAFDKSLAVAAAYTSDVIEFAKDNGVPLDLTLETENELNTKVLPKWVLFKRGQDRGDEWARDQLEKSIASYQLFLLCNYVNQTKDISGLWGTIERNKLSKAGIILQATNGKTRKKVTFDPYAVVANVSEECFAFSDTPTDFVCSLVPFKKEVEAFIEKMSDIADAEESE